MVKIISDSTCDLSEELLERYDVSILPLHILLGDQEYDDGTYEILDIEDDDEFGKVAAEFESIMADQE